MDGSIFSNPESPFSSSSVTCSDKSDRSPPYQRSRSFLSPNRSPCTSPTPRLQEGPFSRQNRRLQLRNAGFRGGLLPNPRPISPQLAVWKSPSGSNRDDNKENDDSAESGGEAQDNLNKRPHASRRKQTGVLQELHNSTQRRKPRAQRPLASTFFQELQYSSPTAADTASESPFNDYRPKTTLLEPFSPETTMRSRDPSSLASRVPSSGLNRTKHAPTSVRTVSHGTSRYIEHLETQLAASLDCTNSGNSPVSNAYASKFKALSAEHRLLKQELAEWEERFENRVQEEIHVMIGRESQLRTKIRTLERELETKSSKIRELEWETEMDRQRLRSLESVNSTNRSLEKRVDVLTGLLAQSPSKSDHELESISSDLEATHRTPRPKSMFSRLPLSPVRRPTFQPLPNPEPGSQLEDEVSRNEIPELDISYQEAEEGRPVSEIMSLDSGLGGSCSSPSTRLQGSQRSSMISQSSGSSIWGTSFPLPLEIPRRHKSMRRFPSGSCTLKPLVLPITSSLLSPSSPSCHSGYIEYSSHARSYSTNEWHSPSNFAQVHEDTLDALEGNTSHYQSFEEAISGHKLSDIADMSGEEDSLDQEFGSSPFPNGHLHPPDFFNTPSHTSFAHREPSKSPCPQGAASESRHPAMLADSVHTESYHNGKPFINFGQSCNLEITPLGGRHYATVEPFSELAVKDTFSCATDWFRGVLSRSMILAKRILFNSWHSNWKRIGRFPWWILGLILGVPRRDHWLKQFARPEIVGHLPLYQCTPEMTALKSVDDPVEGETGPIPCRATTRLSIQEMKKQSQPMSCALQNCEQTSQSSVPSQPSFGLWAKFSLAIALVIGLAIKDGPASLMCPCSIETGPDTTNCQVTAAQGPESQQNQPENIEDIPGSLNHRDSD